MSEAPKQLPQGETFDFYNQQGREYVRLNREFYSDMPDTGRKYVQDALAEEIKGKTIADIGCGAGDDLVTYSRMGAGRVIGVEPSHVMREEAERTLRERGVEAEILEGQWERIPLQDAEADILTSRYSFHVQPNFRAAFQEAARVLKENGLFIVAAPHPLHDAKMTREQQLQPGQPMNVPIYGGKFTVEIPPHTMDDYLSQDYFDLESTFEYSMHEDPNETEPSGMVLTFRKKSYE